MVIQWLNAFLLHKKTSTLFMQMSELILSLFETIFLSTFLVEGM